MSRWPEVALEEVLRKSNDLITLDPEAEYREVTVRNRGQGAVLRRIVTGAEIASLRRLRVHARQFIISRIDARHGSSAVIPADLEGAVVTNDFPVFDCDAKRLLPEYLGWYCKTSQFVDACVAASEGSTNRVRLKEPAFLQIEMPLPPIEEQRRVVRRLEQLAALAFSAQTLRRMADFEVSVMARTVARTMFEASPDWTHGRLCDVAKFATGTTPPSGRADYFDGDVPFFTPADLGKAKTVAAARRTLSAAAVESGKARVFPANIVMLVTIGASLGKVSIATRECSANQQITGITFDCEVLPEFGFYWLTAQLRALQSAAQQATLPILNQKRLGGLPFAYPDLQTQLRIVRFLDDTSDLEGRRRQNASDVGSLCQRLLPRVLARGLQGAVREGL